MDELNGWPFIADQYDFIEALDWINFSEIE
jgi:hypothetical protein